MNSLTIAYGERIRVIGSSLDVPNRLRQSQLDRPSNGEIPHPNRCLSERTELLRRYWTMPTRRNSTVDLRPPILLLRDVRLYIPTAWTLRAVEVRLVTQLVRENLASQGTCFDGSDLCERELDIVLSKVDAEDVLLFWTDILHQHFEQPFAKRHVHSFVVSRAEHIGQRLRAIAAEPGHVLGMATEADGRRFADAVLDVLEELLRERVGLAHVAEVVEDVAEFNRDGGYIARERDGG